MTAKPVLPAAFVEADTTRVDLNGQFSGLWIELKTELSVHEQDRVIGAMLTRVKGVAGDADLGVDYAGGRLEKLATWLVDWNFVDREGRSVPLNRGTLSNLRPRLADTIEAAIDAHQESLVALKAETPSAPS